MREPTASYEAVLSLAKSRLAETVETRREDIATRHGGDRLLFHELGSVARETAESALPREDTELLALAATPGVLYADTWDDNHVDIKSALVHVLSSWIVRDMADEIDAAYADQFGDDGAEQLYALAEVAHLYARSMLVTKNPNAGTRGRYDGFEAAFQAWKRGDNDSLGVFAAESEKVISDLAVDDQLSFQAAGRKFKEVLYFALSRPDRFCMEATSPAP